MVCPLYIPTLMTFKTPLLVSRSDETSKCPSPCRPMCCQWQACILIQELHHAMADMTFRSLTLTLLEAIITALQGGKKQLQDKRRRRRPRTRRSSALLDISLAVELDFKAFETASSGGGASTKSNWPLLPVTCCL